MINVDTLLKNLTYTNRNGNVTKARFCAIHDGKIEYIGDDRRYTASNEYDCSDKLLTPGLIDCHTHLVYAGNRADEHALRLSGVSYQEIARKGGGILSTVAHTRRASLSELFDEAYPRLEAMVKEGVSTVEIKSGYGLDLETELNMLRVAKMLGDALKIRVKTTFLGAHALPFEFKGRSKEYIHFICNEVLPAIAKENLADFVDCFCESIGFSVDLMQTLYDKASTLGFGIKCHAEQLSLMGASKVAAQYKAISSDHLEYIDENGVKELQNAGTVAVLLPGAYYFLAETKKPPIDLFRKYKVPMAVATDCNPGSSPTVSISLMMHMACRFFGLHVHEAIAGVTSNAAKALGVASQVGEIKKGMVADLVLWDMPSPASICYEFGRKFPHKLMIAGKFR